MKYFEYNEPVPGMTADGTPITCAQTIRVSHADAVCIQRFTVVQRQCRQNKLNEDHLAMDFACVHWADEKEDI